MSQEQRFSRGFSRGLRMKRSLRRNSDAVDGIFFTKMTFWCGILYQDVWDWRWAAGMFFEPELTCNMQTQISSDLWRSCRMKANLTLLNINHLRRFNMHMFFFLLGEMFLLWNSKGSKLISNARDFNQSQTEVLYYLWHCDHMCQKWNTLQ